MTPEQRDTQIRQCYSLCRDGLSQKKIASKLGISISTVRNRLRGPEPPAPDKPATPPADTSEREAIRAELSTALRAAVAHGAALAEVAATSRAYQEAVTGMSRATAELAKLHGLQVKADKADTDQQVDAGGKVIPKVPKLTVVRL